MPTSIDIIIPSFRLNPVTLLPILNLQRPANAVVHFYLIADNPDLIPDAAIDKLVDNDTVTLLINPANLGASATRNRGIEAGQGQWMLFLDDDVEVDPNILLTYAQAAEQYPAETGFVGLVTMPPPPTAFARAVDANGSMAIFTAALDNVDSPWGATANLMVSRHAVGQTRFSSAYPKTGGGEEVEFFLRVRAQNGFANYCCLPQAQARHPWWNNGRANYTRFYRYGLGNSCLAQRNTAYRWFDFLNTPETVLLSVIVALSTVPFNMPLSAAAIQFAGVSFFIDYIVTLLRVHRKKRVWNAVLAFNVMRLRLVYEWGILWGNISRGRVAGFGERFNYNGSTRVRHFRLNRFKIIKLVLYAVYLVVVLVLL